MLLKKFKEGVKKMDKKPINTEYAMDVAKGVAEKAGLPLMFTTINSIKKENEEYIIMLSNTLNKNSYKVRINAKTGDVIEWEEMIQQKP